MIGIRTDANEELAMGHVMRCISIAVQLKNQGSDVLFIVSDVYGEEMIKQNGFDVVCLNNDYKKKKEELPLLKEVISQHDINTLLVDSYAVNKAYFEGLKGFVKVCYLDDLKKDCYPVECVINYAMGTRKVEYETLGYAPEKLFLGNRYIPLRPAFAKEEIQIKSDVTDVFITTGGTDNYDMIIGLLKRMKGTSFAEVNKHIILGKFYKSHDKLSEEIQNDNTVYTYQNVQDIWNIMKKCDVAVSAGGTTVAELLALGIPTVCFVIADNQVAGINGYLKKDLVCYAGCVEDDKTEVIEETIKALDQLSSNEELRRDYARRAKEEIDGMGAVRIAEIIKQEAITNDKHR